MKYEEVWEAKFYIFSKEEIQIKNLIWIKIKFSKLLNATESLEDMLGCHTLYLN